MKIAICSDSHDNMPNITKFLSYCKEQEIKTMIHCGDVTEDETKQFFINNFKGKIHFAEGNADIGEQQKQKRTNRFQKIKYGPVPFLDLILDNIKIAACHKKDKAKRLAASKSYNIVFYGHSHKPWLEKIENTHVVNPGNLAGMFHRATFAVYDTVGKKMELKLLEKL
ncbi:YfcE family phosphodiesterase [Candidatus Kuenenbacteria bacterium]|nr:YfcE family phosphodiesterase [Candidatus Kuenenbacteria bacterium]